MTLRAVLQADSRDIVAVDAAIEAIAKNCSDRGDGGSSHHHSIPIPSNPSIRHLLATANLLAKNMAISTALRQSGCHGNLLLLRFRKRPRVRCLLCCDEPVSWMSDCRPFAIWHSRRPTVAIARPLFVFAVIALQTRAVMIIFGGKNKRLSDPVPRAPAPARCFCRCRMARQMTTAWCRRRFRRPSDTASPRELIARSQAGERRSAASKSSSAACVNQPVEIWRRDESRHRQFEAVSLNIG